MPEQTVIAGEPIPEAETKGKRGPKPGSKKTTKADKFSPDEVNEKFHILCSGLAKVFGAEYTFKPKDYDQEAKALVRMADKFPVVNHVLTFFDPVLLVLGLYGKITTILKSKPKTKPAPAEQPQKPFVVNPQGQAVNG